MPLPPPQPIYILRGHTSSITSLQFFHQNLRLVSADADGWVVVWDVVTKRAVAVWKAHGEGVLGVEVFFDGKGGWLVSHGRDNNLYIWQLPSPTSTNHLSTLLPATTPTLPRPHPWLLHHLSVESVGFCSFAACVATRRDLETFEPESRDSEDRGGGKENANRERGDGDEESGNEREGNEESKGKQQNQLILAVPGTADGAIDIFALPPSTTTSSTHKLSTIPPPPATVNGKTGMVMALQVFFPPCPPTTTTTTTTPTTATTNRPLHLLAGYESGRLHLFRHCNGGKQQCNPDFWETIYTYLAHTQPLLSLALSPSVDSFYTSGADSVISKHLLTWPSISSPPTIPADPTVLKTKHAGQQALRVRDDGRLIGTAGWDGRGRVYAAKGMGEVAVLKWHKQGCYGFAFGEVVGEGGGGRDGGSGGVDGGVVGGEGVEEGLGIGEKEGGGIEEGIEGRVTSLLPRQTVRHTREQKIRETHWIALGSKDGKISLWDIC